MLGQFCPFKSNTILRPMTYDDDDDYDDGNQTFFFLDFVIVGHI
mgnify:CR=1 FL=1